MKTYYQKIVRLFTSHDYPLSIKKEFYQWLVDEKHAPEKEEALKELWTDARMSGQLPDFQKSLERWRRTSSLPPARPRRSFTRSPSLRIWQSAVAVLCIVAVSLGYLLNRIEKTEIDLVQQFIPTAEMRTFVLPDGSQVQMNARSTLLYPQQFTGANRSVYLTGEANFKVKPDPKHPFIVKTDDFQVTALGTEFNVSAYPETQEVIALLLSGSVLVACDSLNKQMLLHPGEQLTYSKTTRLCTLQTGGVEDATAWQRGELVFREMTLEDIITVLERKYDYQFIYSLHSLKNDRYSFKFKDQASLPVVMDVIVDVVGNLSFRIQDDKCYIMQKKRK